MNMIFTSVLIRNFFRATNILKWVRNLQYVNNSNQEKSNGNIFGVKILISIAVATSFINLICSI